MAGPARAPDRRSPPCATGRRRRPGPSPPPLRRRANGGRFRRREARNGSRGRPRRPTGRRRSPRPDPRPSPRVIPSSCPRRSRPRTYRGCPAPERLFAPRPQGSRPSATTMRQFHPAVAGAAEAIADRRECPRLPGSHEDLLRLPGHELRVDPEGFLKEAVPHVFGGQPESSRSRRGSERSSTGRTRTAGR